MARTRIDSRLVAKSLDIEHESFLKTLSTYQAELEELGVFRFEIGKPPRGSSGGRPGKYAMLNEDQAIFAATLSRNTKQVVAFKLQLTKAFSEARAKVASLTEQHESSPRMCRTDVYATRNSCPLATGVS